MDYRNANYNERGGIDCEINHPAYGWIPFTASPKDTGAAFDVAELFARMEGEAEPYVAPKPNPEAILATERSTMSCTPLQGILTLGEAQWNKVLNYRDTTATWQEGVIIDSALDWRRNSQNIMFFQYLLGYTDTQVDDLFRAAARVII